MGLTVKAVWFTLGFASGIYFREKNGTINFLELEDFIRRQLILLPARFDVVVSKIKESKDDKLR
jgi:hypothetical protein